MFSLRILGALSLIVATAVCATPALSSQTIVGQVVKQSAPATIDACSVAIDGDSYMPQIETHPREVHTMVAESYDLEFVDAKNQSISKVRVSAPFVRVAGPPSGATGLRCSIAELKFDDGQAWSSTRARDPQAFNNAAIGVVLLAGVAILASRKYNTGPAPASTDTGSGLPTPTPGATSTATSTATATATSTASGRATSTPTPTATGSTAPGTTPAPTVAASVIHLSPTRLPQTVRGR